MIDRPELEDRITRLEQLVAALGLLLDRFRGSDAAFGPTAFDRMDDPAAGHAVLAILVASTADARWDVLALRRAVRTRSAEPDADVATAIGPRLDRLARSARELRARFEAHRLSLARDASVHSPQAVAQLQQIVALSARALLDIGELGHPSAASDTAVATAAAAMPPVSAPAGSVPVGAPATSREVVRSRGRLAAPGGVAGGLWQLVRSRRNRLIAETAAVALVAIVLVGSALSRRQDAPDGLIGAGVPTTQPTPTRGGLAVASLVPGDTGVLLPSVGPGATGEGATPQPSSGGPGTAPPGPTPAPAPTPRPPTPGPQPTPPPATPGPAAAAAQFDSRVTTSADAIDGLLGSITSAVQGGDFAAAGAAADDMAARAGSDRAWLQAHPPATCYQPFQQTAVSLYGGLIDTANDIAAHADAGDDNAIGQDVAHTHGDVSALRQLGNKAVAACA